MRKVGSATVARWLLHPAAAQWAERVAAGRPLPAKTILIFF
jgi:hypothetical protein